MIQEPLAEKLRVLRARRGLTLTDAEELTGVTRETLGDLERGKRRPYMPTLTKIARGYGVPVEELLVEEPTLPLDEALESGRSEAKTEEPDLLAILEWLADSLLGEDLQAASEYLDEYCREWIERRQRGDLDLDAIERFFEVVHYFDHIISTALWGEAVELIRTGQVRVDPHADPNEALLQVIEKLHTTGKLGMAWERWMDLQDELLKDAKALDMDARRLERIEREREERKARFIPIQGDLAS